VELRKVNVGLELYCFTSEYFIWPTGSTTKLIRLSHFAGLR